MKKILISMIVLMSIVFGHLIYGTYLEKERMNDSQTSIIVDIIDITFQNPSLGHSTTIVKTNNSAMIFDRIVSLPFDKCRLTIRDSWYIGEYRLIDYEVLE